MSESFCIYNSLRNYERYPKKSLVSITGRVLIWILRSHLRDIVWRVAGECFEQTTWKSIEISPGMILQQISGEIIEITGKIPQEAFGEY